MASPLDYRRSSGNRFSSSAGAATIDNLTGNVVPIGPIRQASPEQDDAPAPVDGMLSHSGESVWLPSAWMNAIATNDDPILARDGSGLKLYDALLSDDTAMSTLQQRRLAITSREWEVIPGDDADPRSVKAADDFRAMIDGLGFDRVTGLLHYGVWYGYAVGEGLYTIKEHDGRLIVWLDDIVVPDRRHFAFTYEGALRFVAGLGVADADGIVPDNKFVTIRTGGTHDFAFYGLGLAHWCYWPIFFKRAGLKFWALYLEKRGNPTVAVEFTEAEKDDIQKKSDLLAAAVAIGKDSAVLLPEGTLKNERLKIIESQRAGGTVDYKDFVAEQNESIMRVVLGTPGTSKATPGGLGGDGQAKKDEGVKSELVKADSDMITDALGSTFGKWVTRWNHGPDVKAPILRRILDDGEDLNTTAERDVKLDGIGIKRTEDSVKAVYGDGYTLERETPEQKAAREQALAMAKAPAAAIPTANDNPAAIRRQKVAAFAAQGGETAFSPLYVYRPVQPATATKLKAFAKSIGITTPVPDMQVTELYSKTPVDWFEMAGEGWDSEELRVQPGGPRFVERFGDAIVLRFDSPVLRYRNAAMIERGASSDYESYNPHVTLGYGFPDIDLAQVEPFVDELLFGPEIFEPIRQKDPEDGFHAFTAADEDAIERLIVSLTAEADPVFEAMASELRGALQGVTTVEAARVAILGAVERLPIDRLARLTALPMLAERAGASVGADDLVTA